MCQSKETELGSSNQEASPSTGKNTGVVLVPCGAWKCVPTAICSGVDISEVPGCQLLWQMSSQWGSQKLLQGLVSHELTAYHSVFDQFLTQWIVAISSKVCKPDNFESQSSLKLSFTNIQGLHSNFVECESFLESNSPDILALCETNLDDSIDFGNFSVMGYLLLCEGRTSFCMRLISRKLYKDFYLCLRLALLQQVPHFFFLYWSPFLSLCTVFDSISSNIDKFLSINPSANVFVFGDFNVHHINWLIYSGGSDRTGELCYNFSISNDLTQMLNFPT